MAMPVTGLVNLMFYSRLQRLSSLWVLVPSPVKTSIDVPNRIHYGGPHGTRKKEETGLNMLSTTDLNGQGSRVASAALESIAL